MALLLAGALAPAIAFGADGHQPIEPGRPHAATRVAVRGDGRAHALGK